MSNDNTQKVAMQTGIDKNNWLVTVINYKN